ncbi:phage holin family protein [Cytobacillus spongiae]|uniref:phage holin family protein n=1 Tax=Cytobacillus spongiae TaxID=2901381 RepID=UPI001F45417B|nr:phage holin family protein [Cytobacillus spongiae]UII56722.1 phage holin family protein [Cytobacillus spongiae]
MDGNKIVFGIKSVGTAVGSIWSLIVGAMGWAFPTLIIMMAADYITGVMAGAANGGLSSSVGRRGFLKKVYVLILIGSVYLLEKVVLGTQHLGDGVTIAYIIIEFISLAENGGKLGVNLGPINNIIAVLKEKGDGK